MNRTNVYVDGFNLFYGALKGSPYKWLDLEALCHHLLPKDTINRIRYFTAKVSARPDDLQLPVRQDTYLRALATLPTVSVHLGVFYVSVSRAPLAHPPATGPKTVEIIKTEEKGSDVALATYMMLDACRSDCHTAVLITNDSDLREPLRLVRDELGLITGVINPHQASRRSRALQATFFKQLRPAALAASQFPVQVTDPQGRKITKPASWLTAENAEAPGSPRASHSAAEATEGIAIYSNAAVSSTVTRTRNNFWSIGLGARAVTRPVPVPLERLRADPMIVAAAAANEPRVCTCVTASGPESA
jgi:uncharacterized LabA/DUF88 family protein